MTIGKILDEVVMIKPLNLVHAIIIENFGSDIINIFEESYSSC